MGRETSTKATGRRKQMANRKLKKSKAGTSKAAAAERRGKFVEAYIANGGNATQAAIAAGYAANSAGRHADRLVKDGEVRAAIAARAKKLAQKYELTSDLAARSIVQDLTFDPARLFQDDGITPKTIDQIDEDTRMALTGVERDEKGGVKFKWRGRSAARTDLMKHLGMFEKDNTQRGDAAIRALLEAVGDGKIPIKS